MINENVGKDLELKRGDIIEVKFDPVSGDEIGKTRPALIISNDIANRYSSLVIIVPLSSRKETTKERPIYVFLNEGDGGIKKDSFIHCGQIRTIDKRTRINKKIGTLNIEKMRLVDNALKISLALN